MRTQSLLPLPALMLVVMISQGVSGASPDQVDATRKPGTAGSDVVNAVVDVLKAACIFNEDRQFLRRLAYVESRDGTASDTYRPGYDGGVWKVSQDMLSATTSCPPIIRHTCDVILHQFAIDWTHVTWTDLRKPLYSGLAAALYLNVRLGNITLIPASLEGQAGIWSHYYHFGNPPLNNFTAFAEKATEYECTDNMDLVFIMDSSGSISDPNFQLSLDFVAKVVEAMNVPSVVRVSTLIFADAPSVKVYFHTYLTKNATVHAIRNIVRTTGGTATNLALDLARTTVFTTAYGARSQGSTKRVAVLVTDGQSNSQALTALAAERLKRESGVTVFSIGVGGYDLVELQNVASEPKCSHVYTLSDFSVIGSIVNEIQRSTCKAQLTLAWNDTLTLNDTGTITLAPLHNQTLEVSVVCGIAHVYISYTNPNPNPAMYTEMLTATEGRPAYLTTESNVDGHPVYMTVVGSRLPETAAGLRNCTDFGVQVAVVEYNSKVMCCIATQCHECSDEELRKDHHIREVVCIRPEEFHNPCSKEAMDSGHYIFAYPYDPTKFIRCDYRGDAYVTLCPNRETFNPATMTCGFDTPGSTRVTPLPSNYPNPCTPAHIQAQYFFFEYTVDKTQYIHCDLWGHAFLEQCSEQSVWSQADQTCVEDRPNVVTSAPSTPAPIKNPCTPEALAASRMFFPYPCDHTRFIHCDGSGNYWVQFCPGGMFFDPAIYTCVVNDPQQGSQHGCD